MRLTLALAFLMSLPAGALASPLDDALSEAAGVCVKMETVRDASTHIAPLNAAQFEFARAVYAIIPPVSHELPPGDRAEIVTDGETVGVVLIDSDSDQTCARFAAPAFLMKMLDEVGKGVTTKPGERS